MKVRFFQVDKYDTAIKDLDPSIAKVAIAAKLCEQVIESPNDLTKKQFNTKRK